MNMIETKELDKYVHELLVRPYGELLTEEDLLKIKKIVLNKYNIKQEVIEYNYQDLLHFKNLKRCSIEFLDITDELVNAINQLTNLKTLELNMCKINTTLKFENNFENIYLSNMTEEILEVFKNTENITILELNSLGDFNLRKLLDFQNLECFNIYDTNVINTDVLCNLTNLKSLKLAGSSLDNDEKLNELKNKIDIEILNEHLLEDPYLVE